MFAERAPGYHSPDGRVDWTSLVFAERAPGYHTSPHKHDCEQMNYIVSGEIYFFVDGRSYRCIVSDVMRIPRNKVHWAWNRGTETAVVFESHSPPQCAGRRVPGHAGDGTRPHGGYGRQGHDRGGGAGGQAICRPRCQMGRQRAGFGQLHPDGLQLVQAVMTAMNHRGHGGTANRPPMPARDLGCAKTS